MVSMFNSKTKVLDASSFARITSSRRELPTIFDSVVGAAINGTSDEAKQSIEDFISGRKDSDLDEFEPKDRADALIMNAIIFTMMETGCPSDAIGKLVKIPSRYQGYFQHVEKGLFGTPTSDDLDEMFGEA